MKTLAKESLRWAVVVASGGYGTWQLVYAVWHIVTRWKGDWSDLFFCLILVPAVLVAPFLAVAYFCLRRQYRKLFFVLGVVGAVVVFDVLTILPNELGMFRFLEHCIDENHSFVFLALPLAILAVFGPIYAAAWFFRFCARWAHPRQSGPEKKSPMKTQATYWLVWPGVFLMMFPMIGMLFALNSAALSPTRAVVPESSIDNWFFWTMAGTTFGALLLFLGLVRRRPIRDVPEMDVDNPAQSVSASIR